MIERLSNHSFGARKAIFLVGLILLSLLLYKLTIQKTVQHYRQLSSYQSNQQLSPKQSQEIERLNTKLAQLQQQFGDEKLGYLSQAELLQEIQNIVTDFPASISAVPILIEDESGSFRYGISELVLTGDYISLVRCLDAIEQSRLSKRLVSVRYELNDNWSRRKKELLLHLIFKQIKE